MAKRPGATLRRRKLVKELVAARVAAGMTAAQLAAAIDLKPSAVSKIEKGTQGLTVRNIRSYARVTGLSDAKTEELLALAAADDTDHEWLASVRPDLPAWFAVYPELEQDAEEIWNYSSELVHGLVQTYDYTEAVVHATYPGIGAKEVLRIVEARGARQDTFTRDDAPRLELVLNEAVVRRQVGGEALTKRQIRHLVGLSANGTVTIRVLPFSAGAHPGMKTGFTVLRFPEGFTDMNCVYLENENGAVWQDAEEHVTRYEEVFERITLAALSPEESRDLLSSLV